MVNRSCMYHRALVPSKNMKLLIRMAMAACIMVTAVKAKPIFSVKIVEVPVAVPQINVLGAVSKVLGIKAALIGQTFKAKASILHKLANIKGGLGNLLTSSVPKEPVYATASKPVESAVTQPYSPSPTYGAPPPAEVSQTYGAPYPA